MDRVAETVGLRIMIMSGPDDGRVVTLSPRAEGRMDDSNVWTITFGRREECDVSIPFDTQVSRQHATLTVAPDGALWLKDSGSLNGTFVRNLRIEELTPIARGQLFRLGRTWMRVQTDAGSA
jgi:pSer/pThr/pTyr-binding forkhead associated (FHA) protein